MKGELIGIAKFIAALFLKIATTILTFSNYHPDQSAPMNIEARSCTSKKDINGEGSEIQSIVLESVFRTHFFMSSSSSSSSNDA